MARACRHWALLTAAILLQPAASLAALDPSDVVQIQATTSLIRDNNLFRLPDVDPTLFGIDPANKADTARVLGVGLKFDKLISRQRLIADVNLNETVYDKNDNLDFFGGDGRLAWLWRIGNHWNGDITYQKRRSLAGFSDFRQPVQDLIDTDIFGITGGYEFHPRWRLSAELSDTESVHTAPTRRTLNTTSNLVGTELRYRTPSDNSIGMQARRTDRSYPNRVVVGANSIDNGHKETRLNAVATWQLTAKLRLDGQVGHARVDHDTRNERNFTGITWKAAATWDTTAKLRLNLNTARDVRLYEDFDSSYVVVDSVGFSPMYSMTTKMLVQGDLSYEKRDFRSTPGLTTLNQNRSDNVRVGRIALVYSPIRNVDLSVSYEIGDRKSTSFLNSYDYQTWFGTLRLGF